MRRIVLFLLLWAIPLQAQSTEPKQAIVLKAARLFDGRSETLRQNALVVVRDNKIVSVGGSEVSIPNGARVIDLGDVTLLPGFIDCHTHVTQESSPNFYRDFFDTIMRQPAEQAFYAEMYARRTLDAGFTTVRNLAALDYVDVGLRNAINAGVVIGPRMYVSVFPIGSTGSHADSDSQPLSRGAHRGVMEGICNGPYECRAAVRAQIKYGADVIKFMPSGGVLSLTDPVDAPELSQEEMNAIVEEAHHWGRKVAAHCHGDLAAKMAIDAGVDSIEHGTFMKSDTLQKMKEKGVYLVPTRMAFEYVGTHASDFPPAIAEKARATYSTSSEMFRNALRIGVKIAFGTDAGVYPHGQNAHEFALMTKLGMSNLAALRSATSVAATLLGVDDRIGTIESGKLADLAAVAGNPLDDITTTEHVVFVMKDGSVVKDATTKR